MVNNIWFNKDTFSIEESTDNYSLLFNGVFRLKHNKCNLITIRDLDMYPKKLLTIDPTLQYAEIGPGLGGFLEYLVKNQLPDSPKPIAIDPADYQLMRSMLYYGLNIKETEKRHKKYTELIKRCELILDKSKIRFYNCRLEDIQEFSEEDLNYTSDIVIDNFAVQTYFPGYETDKRLENLLKKGRSIENLFGFIQRL